MPDNTRVPVWFTKNVLQNIFQNLAKAKAVDISEFNNSLKTLSTSQSNPVVQTQCSLCWKHPNTEMTKCKECANTFHTLNCIKVHVSSEHGMSTPTSQSILTATSTRSVPPLLPLYSPPAIPGPSGNSNILSPPCSTSSPTATVSVTNSAPTPTHCYGCKNAFHRKSVLSLCHKCTKVFHKTTCMKKHVCTQSLSISSALPPISSTSIVPTSSLDPTAPPFSAPTESTKTKRHRKADCSPPTTPQEAEIRLLKQELVIAKTKIVELDSEKKELLRKVTVYSETVRILEQGQNQALREKYSSSSSINTHTPPFSQSPHSSTVSHSTMDRVINHLIDTIERLHVSVLTTKPQNVLLSTDNVTAAIDEPHAATDAVSKATDNPHAAKDNPGASNTPVVTEERISENYDSSITIDEFIPDNNPSTLN